MRKTLRIFISSPGDVPEERLRAHLVVQKLARDYQRFFRIEPYLWEYEPMLASGHFQDAIEPPSASDIMVLVVYSRLGTPLPERTATREYRGIDGRAPVTGTEWEFEDALEAHRSRGAPDLLAYRKSGDPQTSLADAGKRAEQERQWRSLEEFWGRHFEGGGVFLAGSARFGTLEEFDAKLEADLVRLIEARVARGLSEIAGGDGEATWLQGSPYPGLAAFDFRDAAVFYGRDAEIREASTRLQAAAEEGTAFLLILGASGSGKSSLARAGLLPALFAAKAVPGVGLWRRAILRPGEGGEDPVLGLAKALLAGNPAQGEGLPELDASGMGAAALAAHLQAAPDDPSFPFRQALASVAQEARRRQGLLPHEEARLVLLVDQVEELFTREFDPERRALFVRILAGLARSGVVWVVATVRNDLWHRAAAVPQLVELVEAGARLDLPAPGGAAIFEIVRRPAAAAGLVFEKDHETGVGLDAAIARAAAEEPGALPLLSVLMRSLYERDVAEGTGRALTFAGYRALGELRGAIAQRADEALASLRAADPEAAEALPRLLRALVTASGDGTATSRPARIDAFAGGGAEARLVAALLAERLLVASERDGVSEVRIAHEALLENWPAARERIAVDRRDLQTRARLETLQRRWQEAGTPAERKTALLSGLNLAEGQDLARRWEIASDSGLGAFVAQSQASESWRRRRFAVAAGIVAAVFAAIAALASLQWRRAEEQTQIARAAEETQREARRAADEAKGDAERERDRADGEKGRALAALRESRRNTARMLSAQAEGAAGRAEVGRALEFAVEAGEIEAEALGPGERGTSLPALLRSLADKREVLHLQRGKDQGAILPHDFYGDDALAYADMHAGIMLAELPGGRVRKLAPLPEETLPLYLRAAAPLGIVAVTSVKNLFVVEVAAAKVRAQIGFEERIGALELDEGSRTIGIGTGHAITFVDAEKPEKRALIPVPEPKENYFVGQIRFLPGARRVLVTYGADILEYDRDAGRWSAPLPFDLSSEKWGLTRQVADMMSSQAIIVMSELRPDTARRRFLTFSNLHLVAYDAAGKPTDFDRETTEAVLGMSFGGPDNTGDPMSITGLRSETGYELRISFLPEDRKPLRYDTFRVSAADLGNEQLQGCRLTRANRYLACHYNGKTNQGLHVWRMLGGKHRESQLASGIQPQASAAILPDERLLAGSSKGLRILPKDPKVDGVPVWDETWRLAPTRGVYVPAVSASGGGRVQVLRVEGDRVVTVMAPVGGQAIAMQPGLERAVVIDRGRLLMKELPSGRTLWTVPGIGAPLAVEMPDDGSEVLVAVQTGVLVIDGASGRIKASWPVAVAPGGPVEIDAGRRVAVLAHADGPQRLDLATGALRLVSPSLAKVAATQIALAPGRDRAVVALEDGRIVGLDDEGAEAWSVAPALDATFEMAAMPGQKAHGTIMQLSVSEGGHLAIVRQDIPTIDIHDVTTGQRLTQISAPVQGTPVSASFDRDERIGAVWAFHVILREKPSIVTLHALPLTAAAALEAAKAAQATLVPRGPDGSPRPARTN